MANFLNDDSVQNAVGTQAADTMVVVSGTFGGGDDTFDGLGGNDVANGGTGVDRLSGDGGHDTLFGGFDNDLLYGGSGNDELYGNAGRDLLYGGDGDDLLVAEDFFIPTGLSRGYGENGNDSLLGSLGRDLLYGGEGNDYLTGDGVGGTFATDLLFGGSGGDFLRSAGGNDILNGGSGTDQLDLFAISAGLNIDLALDVAVVNAGAFGTLRISNIESVITGFGADELHGTTGINRLDSGGGDDTIRGLDGNDELIGGNGRDRVFGGPGQDIFTSNGTSTGPGDGDDVMFGGIGRDTFIFFRAEQSPVADPDRIDDFQSGSDQLDFRLFQRGTGAQAEFVLFRFVGSDPFSGAEELRFESGVLTGDNDSDGQADFRLLLTGVTTLTDADVLTNFS